MTIPSAIATVVWCFVVGLYTGEPLSPGMHVNSTSRELRAGGRFKWSTISPGSVRFVFITSPHEILFDSPSEAQTYVPVLSPSCVSTALSTVKDLCGAL